MDENKKKEEENYFYIDKDGSVRVDETNGTDPSRKRIILDPR